MYRHSCNNVIERAVLISTKDLLLNESVAMHQEKTMHSRMILSFVIECMQPARVQFAGSLLVDTIEKALEYVFDAYGIIAKVHDMREIH